MRGPWRRSLLLHSAWSHRSGTLGWAAGAGVLTIFVAAGFRSMIAGFEGGAASFGAAAEATARAEKILVGPAYRLDTLGGYVSYHNFGWIAYFLALYAAIQGVRAIRGDEVKEVLDLYLATGKSRLNVLAARAGGFAIAAAVLGAVLGLLTGVAMALGGSPAWTASLGVGAALALVALAVYAAGLLAGQLFATTRTAIGLTALVVTGLYLLSNQADELGWAAPARFLSPFFYYQQSRYAIVPGHGLDPAAGAVLLGIAVGLSGLAAVLFLRRDVHAAAWRLPLPPLRLAPPRFPERALWTWFLREQPLALAAWALGAFTLQYMYTALYEQVRQVWEGNPVVERMLRIVTGAPLFEGYLSLTLTIAAIVAAAYAVVQGTRWVGERSDGKEELYLAAAPVSRLRLELERWLALAAGLILISAAVVAGVYAGTAGQSRALSGEGLIRGAADTVLLGLAVGGVTALVVAWLKSGAAIGVLGALVGASYFATLLQALFAWPDWTRRFSIFDAFGSPYLREPAAAGIGILATLALGGALAALVAFGAFDLSRPRRRSPR